MAAQDTDLFRAWKRDPGKDTFSRIVRYLDPSIDYHVNRFTDTGLSKSVLRAEAIGLVRQSLDRYNPKKAGLKTFAGNYLKKLSRFATTYGQTIRIPEHRVARIRTFENVKSEMQDRLGRQPSPPELADELGWPETEVGRMEKSLRGVVFESQVPFDVSFMTEGDRISKIVHSVGPSLSPQERQVLYHTFGLRQHPRLETEELARKLKVSPTRIVQIKHRIADQIDRYL